MPLTSQIKKLEGFLQKLIKYEPGLIQVDDNEKHLVSQNRRCGYQRRRRWVGLCTGFETDEIWFSQELEK
jgi:hypothetical protein